MRVDQGLSSQRVNAQGVCGACSNQQKLRTTCIPTVQEQDASITCRDSDEPLEASAPMTVETISLISASSSVS